MKEIKEANTIITISALREIIEIFLGPFLTAYFIKTSAESVLDISTYNIWCYIILAICSLIVGIVIKNRFKMFTFRLGIILNFTYVLLIIFLKENILMYLPLVAILYGLSTSFYYFPFNLFIAKKIRNDEMANYQVKNKILTSVLSILIPILLGSIITVSNYRLPAVIILIISFIQIVLSLLLKPIEETSKKFKLKETIKKIRNNVNLKRITIVEYFVGLSAALVTLTTILIYNSFKTDLNLGIITAISSAFQVIVAYLYGKHYKKKNDSRLILLSGVLPVITLIIFLLFRCNVTVIIFNFTYSIFVNLLSMIRMIKLYKVSNNKIISEDNQEEFWSIRELSLNLGRITGYAFLFIIAFTKSSIALNCVMLILTLFITVLADTLRKVK